MPKDFSSKIKLYIEYLMRSIKNFQSLLKIIETFLSLIFFYYTRKKVSFI